MVYNNDEEKQDLLKRLDDVEQMAIEGWNKSKTSIPDPTYLHTITEVLRLRLIVLGEYAPKNQTRNATSAGECSLSTEG